MRKNRNNNHQRSLLLDDLRTKTTTKMNYDNILSFVRVAGVFVLLFCHGDYTCSCRKSNNNNNGSTVPSSSMNSRRSSYSLFPSGGIRRNGNHDNNNNIFVLSSTQNRKMQYSPKKKKGIDRYDTHENTKDNNDNNDNNNNNDKENEKKRNSQHTHTHPTKNEKMILKCSLSGGEQDIRIPSSTTTKFYSSLQPISYFVSDVVPNFLKHQMLEFIHNPMFFQVDSDDSSPSSTSSILTALQNDSTKTKNKNKKTKQQSQPQQKKEFHRVVFNQKMQLILFLLSALVEEDQAFFVNRHRKSIPGHAINFITSRYIDRRKLLVIGAAARALQLCSPIRYWVNPSLGVASILNFGACWAGLDWFRTFVIGWVFSEELWLLVGAEQAEKRPSSFSNSTLSEENKDDE